MMALPSSNASETATVRMRAWDAEVGGSLLADTGTIYAAPGADLGMWDWEMPLNSNAALYGGDVKATAYFADHVAARRVEIEVIDLDNPAGYIDQARLVVGQYWEPEHNAELGSARVSVIDTSKVSRADSGDPVVDRGTLHSALAFDMTWLDPEDRARLAHILRGCGLYRPLFISIYPESEDVLTEQDCMIYGRIKAMPALTHARLGLFASQLEIEGW
ncbi:hypothetical protein A2G96_08030 [Cupriavidus nantongensis]|uniref:Uncharacterized protein n=2 Tax=Cupriavidus nantongensis TaxID=1796606 RepID=A0A142JHX5_9BURK|nr:hypothetical protein A2G96_08030 [Cupriavidus nantongensis]